MFSFKTVKIRSDTSSVFTLNNFLVGLRYWAGGLDRGIAPPPLYYKNTKCCLLYLYVFDGARDCGIVRNLTSNLIDIDTENMLVLYNVYCIMLYCWNGTNCPEEGEQEMKTQHV
jgi:hypothetical protein